MRGFVVYESLFGNTARIAQAVVDGLKEHLDVELHSVAEGQLLEAGDLLVMGGPTHAFSMSRANTRQEAVNQGASVDPTIGLREWLEELPEGNDTPFAAFDTVSTWCAGCLGRPRRQPRRWLASAAIGCSRGPRASTSRMCRAHCSTGRGSAPRCGARSSLSCWPES